jgi:ketosteroid isomerase-like protein
MSSENVVTIRGYYESLARGDVESAIGVFDPAIRISSPASLPYGGDYTGIDGFQVYVGRVLEHLEDDFRVAADEFIDAGAHVIVVGTLTARAKSRRAPFTASFIHVWRVRGGKAVEWRYVIDTATVLNGLAVPAAG